MNATLTRRSLVTGLAASSLLVTEDAKAALACRITDRGRLCHVGVSIGDVNTALQQCPSWCWAACIQTIFELRNFLVSQDAIVRKLYGQKICSTARGSQIIAAINGTWVDARGKTFRAGAFEIMDLEYGIGEPRKAVRSVAKELANGHPVINGALGHATLLTAMTYLRTPDKQMLPQKIIVRDPWPKRPNKRELTASEFAFTHFIAAVKIEPV